MDLNLSCIPEKTRSENNDSSPERDPYEDNNIPPSPDKEIMITDEEEMDPEAKARELQQKHLKRIYPVKGYYDHENMWEKLLNLEKTQMCPTVPPRYLNNKHRFQIAIQDKVFKIKKNPNYIYSIRAN